MQINNQIKVEEFDPVIHTEETIFNLLIRDKDMIPDHFELMPYPLAHWINKFGVSQTNNLIGSIKSKQNRVFICQHISVKELKFYESDLVFTPHSEIGDKFYSIPHYAVNYDKNAIRQNKKFRFSFIGSTQTHWVRHQMAALYPENCFDSNVYWGLEKNLEPEFYRDYIENLGDTEFSICPRGTGISSVRLFESMAMGSIPVILADGYKKPLDHILNWNSFSVSINESDLIKIPDILNAYTAEQISEMQTIVTSVYDEYFNNDKLHKVVLLTLLKKI